MTRASKAFSQIELLVAIGVLAVGLLAIYASLTFSLRASRHSDRMSQAVALNRQIIDLIRSQNLDRTTNGLNDNATQRLRVDAPPFENDIAGDPPFERNVQIDNLSNNPARPESRLRRVKVTLYWDEDGSPRDLVLEGYQRLP